MAIIGSLFCDLEFIIFIRCVYALIAHEAIADIDSLCKKMAGFLDDIYCFYIRAILWDSLFSHHSYRYIKII